jgi:endonuclease/exonuclease/phosphatase family metal-dependent hydrolase
VNRGTADLAPVLLAAAVAVAGAGLQAAQTPGPAPEAPGLTVAAWNVHRFQATEADGRVTLEGVRDVLDETGAGIVGLQETEMGRPTTGAFDAPGWLGDELGLHAVYGPPTRAQVYGISLLSAYPVEATWHIPLPVRDGVSRVATVSLVDAPGGPLPVYVAHLSVLEQPDDRARQAHALVDAISQRDRALLVGDMNTPAWRGEEAYRILDGALTDAWRAAGHANGTGATAFEPTPDVRIDHVWVKGNWSVDGAHTRGDPALSDHRAVVANLSGPALR